MIVTSFTNVSKPTYFNLMKNKTSVFTGVYKVTKHSSHHKPFRMQFNREGVQTTKCYATEREAAIAYDMMLIKHNLKPINILKKA